MKMLIKKQEKSKLNNLGFSLLELMVTVAIMAVMLGGSITTYRTVTRANVKKANSYINDEISIAREKAKTIAADEWVFMLEATGKTVNASVYKVISEENKGDVWTLMSVQALPQNVKISFTDSKGVNTIKIGNGGTDVKRLGIVFAPLTGKVKSIKTYSETGTVISTISMSGASYCDIVSQHRTKVKKVRIYYLTGKHIEV